MNNKDVRDFIYIDQSRVLSIGSQLLGGLAEGIVTKNLTSSDKQKDVTLKGEVNGEISFGEDTSAFIQLLLSRLGKAKLGAKGEITPHFQIKNLNSIEQSESKVLNHFQFSLLKNALDENKRLKNLDKYKPHEWKPNGKVSKELKPGDFVELTCRVEFVDVTRTENVAKGFEKILELMTQIFISEKVQEIMNLGNTADQAMNKLKDSSVQFQYEAMSSILGKNNINPLEFNAMMELMKNISSDGLATVPLHIIARPIIASKSDVNFVAPIRSEYLIDTKEEIIFKYGYIPEQNWKLLGQVCKISKEEKVNTNPENLDFKQVKKLDKMIEQMTTMFTNMSSSIGMHSYVNYPNISLNLIALYRE